MNEGAPTAARRRTKILAVSGAIAAAALVLGVNGTLSAWTAAIITNDSNTAQAATAVALTESGPDGLGGTATCTTLQSADNTAVCSTINKYGGLTMAPGDTATVDVTFTNSGNASAGSFEYAPGTCTATLGLGSVDLCTDGDLTVAVSCSAGTTYDSANLIAALGQAAATPGTLAPKTLAASPALAAGTSITCKFTTTLSADAPAEDASSAISQPIVWTLSA